MQNQMGSGISLIGVGAATPPAALDNGDMERLVETSDDWITTRTGIRERRISGAEGTLADLGTAAGRNALEMANVAAEDLDLIILATSTPDDLFGSAAAIQGKLGAAQAVAFDLTAACSGFLFGLVTAAQYIRTGVYKRVLLIGADVLSRWVDWSDRRTCILFGDGAGAVVLEASDRDQLLGFEMRSNGANNCVLNLNYQSEEKELLPGINVSQGGYQAISMNGKEVYKFAVRKVPEVIEKAMFYSDIVADDVDWLVLHQANLRIVEAAAQRLKFPLEKCLVNLQRHGNTSAASIPLVLNEAVRDGRIQPGHVIAASGFGAGLSWGAAVFRWGAAA
ncbi:MAG: beta-ketoacyl-ACP synthase III [Cyanobacteria bacterium P01_C01_bin.89]